MEEQTMEEERYTESIYKLIDKIENLYQHMELLIESKGDFYIEIWENEKARADATQELQKKMTEYNDQVERLMREEILDLMIEYMEQVTDELNMQENTVAEFNRYLTSLWARLGEVTENQMEIRHEIQAALAELRQKLRQQFGARVGTYHYNLFMQKNNYADRAYSVSIEYPIAKLSDAYLKFTFADNVKKKSRLAEIERFMTNNYVEEATRIRTYNTMIESINSHHDAESALEAGIKDHFKQCTSNPSHPEHEKCKAHAMQKCEDLRSSTAGQREYNCDQMVQFIIDNYDQRP